MNYRNTYHKAIMISARYGKEFQRLRSHLPRCEEYEAAAWFKLGAMYAQLKGCMEVLRRCSALKAATLNEQCGMDIDRHGATITEFWGRYRDRINGGNLDTRDAVREMLTELEKMVVELTRRYFRRLGRWKRKGLLDKATGFLQIPLVTLGAACHSMGIEGESEEINSLLTYYDCKYFKDNKHTPIALSQPLTALFLCNNAGRLQAIMEFASVFCPQMKIHGMYQWDETATIQKLSASKYDIVVIPEGNKPTDCAGITEEATKAGAVVLINPHDPNDIDAMFQWIATSVGNAVPHDEARPNSGRTIRVFVVYGDIEETLYFHSIIANSPDIEWVGAAREQQEALERIETLRPDVVFMNYVTDGYFRHGLFSQIRIRGLPTAIICATKLGGNSIAEEIIKMEADAYFYIERRKIAGEGILDAIRVTHDERILNGVNNRAPYKKGLIFQPNLSGGGYGYVHLS